MVKSLLSSQADTSRIPSFIVAPALDLASETGLVLDDRKNCIE